MNTTNHVDLWLLPYHNASYEPTQQAINTLSDNEREKFNRCVSKRQKEYLLGRRLLRHGLQHTLNHPITKLEVTDRDGLPPQVPLAEQHNIQFSISHSHNLIAVSILQNDQPDTSKIGLDVELIKPITNFDTTRFFCNNNKQQILDTSTCEQQKIGLYYHYWTLKEAYLKAHHKGIGDALFKQIDFDTNNAASDQTELISTRFNHPNNLLPEQYQIAHYCSRAHHITTRVLTNIDQTLDQFMNIKLDWDTFSLKYS